MARIAGVDLPREKRVQVGLTYVYGIGQTTANKILEATGINPDTRVKDLTLEEEAKIRDYGDKYHDSDSSVAARFMFKKAGVRLTAYTPSGRKELLEL